jgi:hypothetical protein
MTLAAVATFRQHSRMNRFRYERLGRWFKGNTHIHSRASDGGLFPAELAALYAGAGYDFLFRTDHWVCSNVASEPPGSPLLWMDGIELDGVDSTGAYFHVVGLGSFKGIVPDAGLEAGLKAIRDQGGLLILAHPLWCANTLDDALRWPFDGVEIYNHVAHWMNGKSDGMTYWTSVLARRPATLGVASDDTHFLPEHPGWNGGWIMLNAETLSRDAIMTALRAGRFYSTCGPDFLSFEAEGSRLTVRTSPVRFIRLVGPASSGQRTGSFDGPLITEAGFEVPPDWAYAYLEIEDALGRRARTNSVFV